MKSSLSTQPRRPSRQLRVGGVAVGGDAPVSVQTMTNTDTCDVESTVAQIERIEVAGADMVRVSVPDMAAAEAFASIRQQVRLPLIADIHFDFRIALRVLALGADCLRLNPGNIGRKDRVREVVAAARDLGVPMRIGINAGSLEKDLQARYGEPCPEALVESAMRQVALLESLNFEDFKLSIKSSDVLMAVASYRRLAELVEQPLHLGITEAGSRRNGTVKSALGMGVLLMEGIGDTLRVSLADDPVEEVRVGFDLLKSLHLRSRGVNIIACPSCSRQNFDVIDTVNKLEQRLEDVLVPVDVAIIGCYVNGPGESRAADLGVTGASPRSLIYIDGAPSHKVDQEALLDEMERLVRERVARLQATDVRILAKG